MLLTCIEQHSALGTVLKFFMFYLLIHCLLYFTAEMLLLFGRGQSDNDSQAID